MQFMFQRVVEHVSKVFVPFARLITSVVHERVKSVESKVFH